MGIDVNAIEQTVVVTAVGDEVNVNVIDQPVLVSVTDQIIEVEASGGTGPQGPAGAGVAVGGTTGQVLSKASNTNYDTVWVDAGAGTVYSVDASGSTGISVTGGPITGAGTLTITNTLPDQIVGLTAAGTAVITGTYPNFTITTNDEFDGTVTSVNLTAGTGISVSGGPIVSSGSISVTNTAPDQVVSLTGGGTTTITGTYPNFTISSADSNVGTVTSVDMTVPTGLTISGNPITSAGTLALALASGYSIPTTANQANWTTAYNDSIVSAGVTGTTTKTLTLNQQDGGTVTASWTDDNTDAVTSVFGRTGAVIAVSGDYTTAQVTEATNLYFTGDRVRATLLTGLNLVGGGTIAATDSILQAFGKTQNQISALVGGVMYEGVWNASTNSPAIVSSVGNKGDYYVVSVAGSTNIDGISDWKIGDWIIFNGTTWDKVDNTDAVSSVNGFTGAVSLTTANIAEVTNLYFTDTRARNAITLTTTGTSGASTYSGGTLNIPIYSLSGLGGVPSTRTITINGTTQDLSADRTFNVGTVTSVDISVPTGLLVSGNPITTSGTLAISLASGYVIPTQTTLDGKVPYTGATTNVNLGTHTLTANDLVINHPSGSGAAASISKGGNGEALTVVKGSGSGNAASITGGVTLLDELHLTTDLADAYIASAATWNAKQNALNGTGFVKISGTTISYDNSTYYSASNPNSFIALTALSAGTGISYSSTTGVITNTAPDQVVSLSAGSGISISGTYPSFTIASTITQYTDALARLAISESATGLDYNNTTGVFSLTSGYVIPTTSSATNWDAAYNDKINSAAVTGTTTKTLTLNQQDGGTITASWTDDNTDAVTSVFGRTGVVVATSGDYTTTLVTEGTNLYYTEGRVSANTDVAANTAARHNAVTIGTANGLSLSTQQLSLALASGSTTGALSSTDWTTFNNKQNTITNPVTGTGTTNYLPKWTSGTALVDSLVFDNGTNVGIGSATPVSIGTGVTTLDIQGSAAGGIAFGPSGTKNYIYGSSTLYIEANATAVFTTGGSERMRLTSTGLGIGTTSPLGQLDVYTGTFNRFYTSYPDAFTSRWNLGVNGFIQQDANIQELRIAQAYTGSFSAMTFYMGASERMRLTASGNLGLGVVPSAWRSGDVVIDLGATTSLVNAQSQNTRIYTNTYVASGGTNTYKTTNFATYYDQGSGAHRWFTAPSGTAGNAISFTQAMTLTAGGNLLLGTTTDVGYKIFIGGTALVSGRLDIQGTTNYSALKTTNTSGNIYWGVDNSTGSDFTGTAYARFIYSEGAYPLITYVNGSERLRITSGGNLGLGTTSPADLLTLQRNDGRLRFNNTAGTRVLYLGDDFGSGGFQHIYDASGNIKVQLSAGVSYFNGGNVGIGTTSPAASSLLDVTSTTQGFLPPRMTTTQKNAIGSPAAGLIVFDTTLVKLCVHNGTTWETITSL